MRTQTFNVAHYLPQGIPKPQGVLRLQWMIHALNEAAKDDVYYAAEELDTEEAVLVELTVDRTLDNKLVPVKALYRMALDSRRDICLVVKAWNPGVWRVISAWTNHRNDHHSSLDTRGLVSPPVYVEEVVACS